MYILTEEDKRDLIFFHAIKKAYSTNRVRKYWINRVKEIAKGHDVLESFEWSMLGDLHRYSKQPRKIKKEFKKSCVLDLESNICQS